MERGSHDRMERRHDEIAGEADAEEPLGVADIAGSRPGVAGLDQARANEELGENSEDDELWHPTPAILATLHWDASTMHARSSIPPPPPDVRTLHGPLFA